MAPNRQDVENQFQALPVCGGAPPGKSGADARADYCGLAGQGDGGSGPNQAAQSPRAALPAALLQAPHAMEFVWCRPETLTECH